MFCRKCGKQIPDDSKFCYKCGTPVEMTLERSATEAVKAFFAEKYGSAPVSDDESTVQTAFQTALQQTLEEKRIKDGNTPVVLVNVNIITKIISYVALGLDLFFEFVIAKNIDVSTYDGVMAHNAVIIFSYVFLGIFLCCLLVRIICALIIAGMRGELKGTVTFIVVGLIITIILGAVL